MIDILLATYNGEAYLRQQIDSILAQTFQKWHLIIRDDGSCDNTRNICTEYVERYPDRIQMLEDNLGNLGIHKNFETLLKSATNEYIINRLIIVLT
jgi:glycosyltransferase involved in cell wall biosynthesis